MNAAAAALKSTQITTASLLPRCPQTMEWNTSVSWIRDEPVRSQRQWQQKTLVVVVFLCLSNSETPPLKKNHSCPAKLPKPQIYSPYLTL